ncbi:prolyl oligopeptidase family serine peptidase [Chryseobacterium sp. 1B4]
MPLIVSLHTWVGDYTQEDKLSEICKKNNWNYIHPDFQGRNNTFDACVSPKAIKDIDNAIEYAIKNSNCDRNKVSIVGLSGGAYATIAALLKSKHKLYSISAWCPISDLNAWYSETQKSKLNYAEDVYKCVGSQNGIFNSKEALKRSPIFWNSPDAIRKTRINLYAGLNDAVVPISHSINFYNKTLNDIGCTDNEKFVSTEDVNMLKTNPKPVGKIGSRDIYLHKNYENISLVIFKGGHEMIENSVLQNL